ncbi:MAG: Gldg family protein [Anaerolineaceae bacterium]
MKAKYLLIAIGLFLLPVLARTLWYYQGIYTPSKNLQTPDFLSLEITNPELSTPFVSDAVNTGETNTVVFDLAHANQYQISEIEILIDDLKYRGAEIVTLDEGEDLNTLLKGASAFVSIAPTMNFTEDEIQQIQVFVERGGRLLVIADPTRSSSEYAISRVESVQVANKLLEPYQITFRNDYAYNVYDHEGNFRNVFLQPEDKNGLTNNVGEIVFYAARTISSYELNVMAGNENTLSSLTDTGGNLCLVALSEENVLAMGDFTFLTSPYYQVADNYQFITNISQFLINSERQKTLDDFPYVFSRPIGILASDKIVLDQDLLEQISDLKEMYAQQDLPVEFLESDNEEYDLIVLGFIPPDQTIQTYLTGFDIQFGSQTRSTAVPKTAPSATVNVEAEPSATLEPTPSPLRSGQVYIEGFGQVSQNDFGFFFLKTENERTTLIILSDNQDDLVDLLALLANGSLESCFMENNIALCEQNNTGWKSTSTPIIEVEKTLEATPTLTVETE